MRKTKRRMNKLCKALDSLTLNHNIESTEPNVEESSSPIIETNTVDIDSPMIECPNTVDISYPTIETNTVDISYPTIETNTVDIDSPMIECPNTVDISYPTVESSSSSEFKFPEFTELSVSTITVVVYTNIFFDFLNLFKYIPITAGPLGNIPVKNRKRRQYNKKVLDAPYGSIVMVNSGNHIRGLDMRKTKKKHWCAYTCRLTQKKGEKMVRVNTVIEEYVPVGDGEMKETHYFCTNCRQYYTLEQLDKICNFLNQLTVVLSLGNGTYLSIMIFSNKIKIAGCRRKREAYEAIMILWENYIRTMPYYIPLELYNQIEEEKPTEETVKSFITKFHSERENIIDFVPKFLFRTVMRNVGFNLGFYIDRQQFNNMMTDYSKTGKLIKESFCDTTAHPNVRTKYYTYRPEGHTFRLLSLPYYEEAYFENVINNDFKMVDNNKKPKKEKKKVELLTAIVFSSSQVIFSTRYKADSKRIYALFIDSINKHRIAIAEKNEQASQKVFDLSEFIFE